MCQAQRCIPSSPQRPERFGVTAPGHSSSPRRVPRGRRNSPGSDGFPLESQDAEGQQTLRSHQRRERSPILAEAKRRAFRAEHGALRCESCSLGEGQLPTELGEACFEVHHLRPLAELGGPTITRLDDLALLCANCHRMTHRSNPMLLPNELARRRRDDA